MSEVVHLLWFVKEMPEGEGDIELLIGVYSTEAAVALLEPLTRQREDEIGIPSTVKWWRNRTLLNRKQLARMQHYECLFAK